MKTGRKMRRVAGVAVAVGVLLIGLTSAANTVDHFFELISEFDPGTAEDLVPAMYMLDDDLSDVGGNVEAHRELFMRDPRQFLLGQGVDLPAELYSVVGLDIGALKDLPNVFYDSPLAEGMTALPYTIGWKSHNTIILMQLAAREPVVDESGNVVPYAAGDTPATQEYLRAVVNTPDLLLVGMLEMLVQLTRNDGLRTQAVEMGLREFAVTEDLQFATDRFGLQIIDLDPAGDQKPELGVHFSISEGSGPSAPEFIGFIFIPVEGASYAVAISHTF